MSEHALIWDIDGTLVFSDHRVGVPLYNANGEFIRKISANEYSSYTKNHGEYFDYTEANTPHIFLKNAVPSPIFFDVFCHMDELIDSGAKITPYILTARQKNMEDAIHEFLQSHGITNLARENVIGLHEGFAPEGKRQEIIKIRDRHPGEVYFFDDCHKNISHANTIEGVKAFRVNCQVVR